MLQVLFPICRNVEKALQDQIIQTLVTITQRSPDCSIQFFLQHEVHHLDDVQHPNYRLALTKFLQGILIKTKPLRFNFPFLFEKNWFK